MKASTPTTSCPSPSRRSTSVEPIKPAAPVTRTRIRVPPLVRCFSRGHGVRDQPPRLRAFVRGGVPLAARRRAGQVTVFWELRALGHQAAGGDDAARAELRT